MQRQVYVVDHQQSYADPHLNSGYQESIEQYNQGGVDTINRGQNKFSQALSNAPTYSHKNQNKMQYDIHH